MRIEGMTTTSEAPAKTLTQLVALEIRLEMVRQDLKQSDLSRAIGKNEQWLSVRLRGRQPIDLNDLALIASALGVPVVQLVPSDPDAAAVRTNERLPEPRPFSRRTRLKVRAIRSATRRPSTVHPTQRRPNPLRPPGQPIPV